MMYRSLDCFITRIQTQLCLFFRVLLFHVCIPIYLYFQLLFYLWSYQGLSFVSSLFMRFSFSSNYISSGFVFLSFPMQLLHATAISFIFLIYYYSFWWIFYNHHLLCCIPTFVLVFHNLGLRLRRWFYITINQGL